MDREATAQSRVRSDHSVVRASYRLDDREAEAKTIRSVGRMGCEPLEGLEETLHLACRDQRAGVGNTENRAS